MNSYRLLCWTDRVPQMQLLVELHSYTQTTSPYSSSNQPTYVFCVSVCVMTHVLQSNITERIASNIYRFIQRRDARVLLRLNPSFVFCVFLYISTKYTQSQFVTFYSKPLHILDKMLAYSIYYKHWVFIDINIIYLLRCTLFYLWLFLYYSMELLKKR